MSEEVAKNRHARYPVRSLFLKRWSPRAMSGEKIGVTELMTLFEAARWAPSSYNNQPWRFLYGLRDTEEWSIYFDLLGAFNQKWAKDASALIMMVSKKTFDDGKPSRTHSFDAGAAWENLALQGSLLGLIVHAMQGFDYDRARRDLKIPDDFDLEAMAAVGKPGKKEHLPESIQKREFPSTRKALSELVMRGTFPNSHK